MEVTLATGSSPGHRIVDDFTRSLANATGCIVGYRYLAGRRPDDVSFPLDWRAGMAPSGPAAAGNSEGAAALPIWHCPGTSGGRCRSSGIHIRRCLGDAE